MSVELTFNISAKDDAPESPKELQTEYYLTIIKHQLKKLIDRFIFVTVEFTFNASAMDDTPVSPMSFS